MREALPGGSLLVWPRAPGWVKGKPDTETRGCALEGLGGNTRSADRAYDPRWDSCYQGRMGGVSSHGWPCRMLLEPPTLSKHHVGDLQFLPHLVLPPKCPFLIYRGVNGVSELSRGTGI